METEVSDLELKVLLDLGKIVGQALKLEQALDSILKVLSVSLSVNRATVFLKDPETGLLKMAASYGLSPEDRRRGIDCLDAGVMGLILQAAQPFVLPKSEKEPQFLPHPNLHLPDKGEITLLGVPLTVNDTPMGIFMVDRLWGNKVPLAEDFRLLSLVGLLMAQIVQLNQEVKAREEGWRRENLSLRAELSGKRQHFLWGKSPAMREVRQVVTRVAPSRAGVWLWGESGTGKSLLARVIHDLSPRAGNPFVKVNCASLPEPLLEAELFGFEPGGFPGAAQARPGGLEEAAGGTLFLEEIGELSPALQAKLLRFLNDWEFERLGSTKTRKVDLRLLAASTRNLADALTAGRLREDLYYRLHIFPIYIPPLRERREDIPPLLNHFLDKVSREYGPRFYFNQSAWEILSEYAWPGNVQEMENLLAHLASVVQGSEIDLKDLPSHLFSGVSKKTALHNHAFLSRLKELEKKEILAALERNRWIQSQAAVELGLTLRQIGYRVKQFGLERMIKEQRSQGHTSRSRP